jgi:hypothetical protein
MDWIFDWQDWVALGLCSLGLLFSAWLWRRQDRSACAKCPSKGGF